MTEIPRFTFPDLLAFLLIVVGAGVVRVGYVWEFADQGRNTGPFLVQDARPPVGDNEAAPLRRQTRPTELDALAHHLKEERTFKSVAPLGAGEELTAHIAPGYPVLLAGAEELPLDAGSIDPFVRWFQCALGALTAGIYFLFGRRAFHSRLVGLLAGVLCAVHPFWVVNVAELDDGTVTSFLLALSMLLGARGGQEGGAATSLLYGLSLAALSMVRAALLPFGVVATVWYLLRSRSLPRGWLYGLLAFLGFVNGLAFWVMRDYRTLGDVMPVVDSAYLHLWEGNNSKADGGPEDAETMRAALVQTRGESGPAELAKMKQPERYAQLGHDVLKGVQDDPTGTVERRLRAGLYFFFGADWFKNHQALTRAGVSPEEGLPSWLANNQRLAFAGALLAMLLLGVLGWRWTYAWRADAMPAALAVMWGTLPYLLGHAEALHGPRLPLDGIFLTYAAFALACLVPTATANLLGGRVVVEREYR